MHSNRRGTRASRTSTPLAAAAALTLLLLFGCSGGEEDPLQGTGIIVEGDQCFLAEIQLLDADPTASRRTPPACTPEGVDLDPDDEMCPADLDDLDILDVTMIDQFAANSAVLGEITPVDGDVQIVRLAMLGQDDEGRRIFLIVEELDLIAELDELGISGAHEGILPAPGMQLGACEFTVGVDLDTGCDDYLCEWQDTSTLPCGGAFDSTSDVVPVSCYEDNQPDGCTAPLAWGDADSLTITEITVAPNDSEPQDAQMTILEGSVISGRYSATLRAAYPDGTYAELQITDAEFRAQVASSPFFTVPGDELVQMPCAP